MKYCVPEDRPWMCTNFKPRECQKLNENWEYFPDGICRDKNSLQPSQIVCPIGKVLCANLSCADNHYLCPNSTETPSGKIRCVNQQVTKNVYELISAITCPDKDQVLCNDGNCVENEIYCQPIKKCPDNYPYFVIIIMLVLLVMKNVREVLLVEIVILCAMMVFAKIEVITNKIMKID